MPRLFRRLAILLKKNYWVDRSNFKTTLLSLVLIPIFFLLILLGINQVIITSIATDDQEHPNRVVETWSLPTCEGVDKACTTFIYNRQDNAAVEDVISSLVEKYVTSPADTYKGFSTSQDVNDYLFDHPDEVYAGLVFEFDPDNHDTIPPDATFYIQTNFTKQLYYDGIERFHDVHVPFQLALMSVIYEKDLSITPNVTTARMPHPNLGAAPVFGTIGPLYYFWVLFSQLIFMVLKLVNEKESRQRFLMKVMSLNDLPYWLSYLVWFTIKWATVVAIFLFAGYVSDIAFFVKTDLRVNLALLLSFGFSVVSLAILLASLVGTSSTGTSVTFSLFVIFTITHMLSGLLFSDAIPDGWRLSFKFFAPIVFSKGLGDVVSASEVNGLSWDDIGSNATILPLSEVIGWLLLDGLIYLVLGLYFDNVLSIGTGAPKAPWYFLDPHYWGKSVDGATIQKRIDEIIKKQDLEKHKEKMDKDVYRELEKMVKREASDSMVQFYGLKKVFSKPFTKNFVAVENIFASMERNQLVALLGPNGSGKTTTINMIIGMLAPTAGDVIVNGKSCRYQVDAIREDLGVCFQHDVFWEELTARQHIELFSVIRGLDRDETEKEVKVRLEEAELLAVQNNEVGSYSGGMKRRLSVAIALVGNPSVVLLDEPSTGLDSVSRRHLHHLIQNSKNPNRIILLTTHSMEEAEYLSDNIAILAYGKLKAIGNSLRLKNRFGAGYRISFMHNVEKVSASRLYRNVLKYTGLTRDELEKEKIKTPGILTLKLAREKTGSLLEIFEALDENKRHIGYRKYNISQTNLEEVFMSIAKDAAREKYFELLEENKDNQEFIEELKRVRKREFGAFLSDDEETETSESEEEEEESSSDDKTREYSTGTSQSLSESDIVQRPPHSSGTKGANRRDKSSLDESDFVSTLETSS